MPLPPLSVVLRGRYRGCGAWPRLCRLSRVRPRRGADGDEPGAPGEEGGNRRDRCGRAGTMPSAVRWRCLRRVRDAGQGRRWRRARSGGLGACAGL